MSYSSSQSRSGFTLVELLVVIAIIGLLSVLSVIALGSAREKARDAKRISDMEKMQSVLELYFIGNNEYPVSPDPVALGTGGTACFGAEGFGPAGCANSYLQQVPTDPGASVYQYVSQDGSSYSIRAELEGDVADLSGIVVATPSGIANGR